MAAMANPVAMAMRPISQPPTCDGNAGFSLVEVLVAVVILAILVAAASRGLMTSLASDEASEQIFIGTLAMNRIEAAMARAEESDKLKTFAGPGWSFDETQTSQSETNAIAWRIIGLRSEIRPTLRLQSAARISERDQAPAGVTSPATF
jgi:prepilin-type N-terminal cleavage/methylation domain-containing protein